MAGMFDDLIPQQAAAAPAAQPAAGGGMFDDLIPAKAAPSNDWAHQKAPDPRARSNYDAGNGVLATVHQGLNEANKALAGPLTALPDVAAQALRGGSLNTGGDRPVESAYKRAFVQDIGPPEGRAQELAGAGGRMLGGNLPYMVGGAGLANSGIRSGIPLAEQAAGGVASKFRGGVDALLDAIRGRPVTVPVGETVASVESGAGGEIARKTAQDSGASPGTQHAAESLGQLAGPPAANLLPGAIAARYAAPVAKGLTGVFRSAAKSAGEHVPEKYRPAWLDDMATQGADERTTAARGAVGRELNSALAQPEARTGLNEAEQLQKDIPGFSPGVARATADPALLNTQQKLDTNATGVSLRTKQAAFDKSRGAIEQKAEDVVPQAEAPKRPGQIGPNPPAANPQDVAVNAAQARVGRLEGGIERQQAATNARLQGMTDTLPPENRIATGDALRNARAGAEEASNRETTRLRQAIAAPDTPVQVGQQQMTVNAALDRQTAINQQLRDYNSATARSVEDVQQMRALQDERTQIGHALDGVNLPGMQEFRAHYRDQHVPQFVEGAGRDTGRYAQFGYGKNKVADEKVAGRFFNSNEESAARQFDTAMGHDPQARQSMVDNALGDLRHTAIDPTTGVLREGAVNRWLQKNERVLAQMPQTGAEIRTAVQARNPDALYQRLGQLEQRQRTVADTKVAQEVSKLAAPGTAPEKAIHSALNDHVLMRQLMNSARNDPAAQGSVRRAVWESVRREAPDAVEQPEKFMEWVNGHRRSLSVALTPEHIRSLETVAKAATMQNRLGRPQGKVQTPKSLPGAVGEATGVTVPSFVGSLLAVARGRTSPFTEAGMQAVKLGNKQAERAAYAAWDEALSNPEMAKTLADSVKGGQPTQMQVRKMYTYLLANGALHGQDDQK